MSLLPLILAAVLLLVAAALWKLGSMLLHPPRMTDGRALYRVRRLTPVDLDLPFEPCAFDVIDEPGTRRLKLAAWWIPASQPSDRTAILLHGYGDAKVGAIAWAPLLHQLGLHVLAIDLRAHGHSEGRVCTGGDRESNDIAQVIHQFRAARPDVMRRLVLFGISLGGATAIATAAREDVDVDAVIGESVYGTSFADAAAIHARLIGAPLRCLHRVAIRFALWRAGINVNRVGPADCLRRVRCPVLLFSGDADPFLPFDQRDALHTALTARGETRDAHIVVPGAFHCMAMVVDPKAYRDRVRAFLSNVL